MPSFHTSRTPFKHDEMASTAASRSPAIYAHRSEVKQTASCDSCTRRIEFLCSLTFDSSPVSQVVVCHYELLSLQDGSMQHALHLRSKHQTTTYAPTTDKNSHKYLLGLATLIPITYPPFSVLTSSPFRCLFSFAVPSLSIPLLF